jgi:methionyl-tRNA synthetase
VQLIGKDILWFHAVIWPAILISAGIELPKTIFAHGWWTFDKEKISKSRGKVINVDELAKIAGVDSARYFLFRETPFGQDGDFSEQALVQRHNDELADKLGNLISRVFALAEKYGIKKCENKLLKKLKIKEVAKSIENYEFSRALNLIFEFIDFCNGYVQKNKIWETHDKEKLYELCGSIKAIAVLLWPFIPASCERIAEQLDFRIESINQVSKPLNDKLKIKKISVLFPKI